GQVKQLTVGIDFDGNPNSGQDYDIIDLNKKGDVTKVEHGFHGSVLQFHYVTTYNSNGRKSETNAYFKFGESNLNQDPLMKHKQIDTGKKFIFKYKYNERGYIIQYALNTNGRQSDSSIYKYDSEGNMIECDHYNPELFDIMKYKYDDKNNLIEFNKFTRKNFLEYKAVYEYKRFDSNETGTKAIVHSQGFYGDESVRAVTVTRKISYY